MPSKEEDFKHRFAAILQDLQENGANDPEALWLIGSLACGIVEKSSKKSWADFKRTITQDTYTQLLADFEKEGNRQYREGDQKKAYAIQVLGVSQIAPTQKGREMSAGDALLDQMIERTIGVFRSTREPKPN